MSRHRYLRPAYICRILLLGAALAGLTGCVQGPALDDRARLGPFFVPRNFAGEPMLPAALHRVLVLPVSAGELAPAETAVTLDAAIVAALQQQQRFEIVVLGREEALRRFGAREFSSVSALPHGFLEKCRDYYGCEGVLFVDLTVYHPYRPQALGFRAKLALIQDVRLIWNFDETFSAENPAVVNSVRRYYYRDDTRSGPPVDFSASALQSPGRFAAYAADAMFSTLPPR